MRKTPLFLYHGATDQCIGIKDVELSYEAFIDQIYTGKFDDNF
jgi:predicted esterase